METTTMTKERRKVNARPIRKIRPSIITSDSIIAVIMEKHKLEPSRGAIIGEPFLFESDFIRKMETRYGHLFGKYN